MATQWNAQALKNRGKEEPGEKEQLQETIRQVEAVFARREERHMKKASRQHDLEQGLLWAMEAAAKVVLAPPRTVLSVAIRGSAALARSVQRMVKRGAGRNGRQLDLFSPGHP